MSRYHYRYRYGGRDKDGKFITVALSNDYLNSLSICEAMNYELQKRVPKIKVGKRTIPEKWITLKSQTNQIHLFER